VPVSGKISIGSLAFLFAAGANVPLLFLGIVLFGAGLGNNTSLPPLIAQAEFNKENLSRVVPLIVAISQAAYAFAPAAFGLIRAFTPHGLRYQMGLHPGCLSLRHLSKQSALRRS
jgi:hypothetical protein